MYQLEITASVEQSRECVEWAGGSLQYFPPEGEEHDSSLSTHMNLPHFNIQRQLGTRQESDGADPLS